MDPASFLGAAIPVLVLIAVAGAWRRIAIHREGQHRQVELLKSLASVPRRFLVDLHSVVVRCRLSAFMHAAVAGGFLGCLVLMPVQLLWPGMQLPDIAGMVAAAVMLAGASAALWRRIAASGAYPDARSGGKWTRLGWTAALAACGFLLWFGSYGTSWAAALILVVTLADLIANAGWRSALRHAWIGTLWLGFHPRPGRFTNSRQRETALDLLDLDSDDLGVARADQWDWTRRLGFDACVECGRCESACPATASGQPLNPKALIQSLLAASGLAGQTKRPPGNSHSGRPAVPDTRSSPPIVPGFVSPASLWSCTTCRACVEECPMMIEHVDAVIDLRRHEVLEEGAVPGKAAAVLANYACTDTPGGGDPARRFDWAEGLGIPVLTNEGSTDCLLWAGEAAFDSRGQRTLRALVQLLGRAGVELAVLGQAERDIGDAARRLGDEATFQRLARSNIALLDSLNFNRIVTPDPHVVHSISAEYPSLGGNYKVLHHSQILAELLRDGSINADRLLDRRIAFHDPCYLGRYLGEFDAPRSVIGSVANAAIELERNRQQSRCCGWGGGAAFTDIPGKRRIPELRMDDAVSAGAEVVAVACPNCAMMLEGSARDAIEIVDIAELVAEAVGIPA